MGNHLLTVAQPRASRRIIAMTGVIGLSTLLGLAPAAFADNYTVPGLVEVGTNGDDAGQRDTAAWVSVSQGGCAYGGVAVAIGDSSHPCPWWAPYETPGQDAAGHVAIGLLGGDSNSWAVSVADTGDATTCETDLLDICVGIAVSGTGTASGRDLAVSGAGHATSSTVGVSGTGAATGPVAVSGTDNATGNIAVSGTGNADGSTLGVSVLGTITELLP